MMKMKLKLQAHDADFLFAGLQITSASSSTMSGSVPHFRKRLVDFAATLLRYKSGAEIILPQQHQISQFTQKKFHFCLQQHIQNGWASITNYFQHAIQIADHHLYYTGPPITIRRRTQDLIMNLQLLNMTEQVELSHTRIYGDFGGEARPTASTSTKSHKRVLDQPTNPSMQSSPDYMKRARRGH